MTGTELKVCKRVLDFMTSKMDENGKYPTSVKRMYEALGSSRSIIGDAMTALRKNGNIELCDGYDRPRIYIVHSAVPLMKQDETEEKVKQRDLTSMTPLQRERQRVIDRIVANTPFPRLPIDNKNRLHITSRLEGVRTALELSVTEFVTDLWTSTNTYNTAKRKGGRLSRQMHATLKQALTWLEKDNGATLKDLKITESLASAGAKKVTRVASEQQPKLFLSKNGALIDGDRQPIESVPVGVLGTKPACPDCGKYKESLARLQGLLAATSGDLEKESNTCSKLTQEVEELTISLENRTKDLADLNEDYDKYAAHSGTSCEKGGRVFQIVEMRGWLCTGCNEEFPPRDKGYRFCGNCASPHVYAIALVKVKGA